MAFTSWLGDSVTDSERDSSYSSLALKNYWKTRILKGQKNETVVKTEFDLDKSKCKSMQAS